MARHRLPPLAEALLTRVVPCGIVLALMQLAPLGAAAWLGQVPLLGPLALALTLALNLLAPAVVAFVSLGGGVAFGLKAAAVAAALVWAAGGFAPLAGAVALVVYGVAPALAAGALMRPRGLVRSARLLAWMLAGAVFAGFLAAAAAQGATAEAVAARWLAHVLVAPAGADAGAVEAARRALAHVLPGLLAAALWVAWWGDLLLARALAVRHGFFRGDARSVLTFRLPPAWGVALAALLVAAEWLPGEAAFWSANAAFAVGAPITAEGVLVAHAWLAARGMQLAVALMYLMLMFWSAIIPVFLLIGVADLWADFRKLARRS